MKPGAKNIAITSACASALLLGLFVANLLPWTSVAGGHRFWALMIAATAAVPLALGIHGAFNAIGHLKGDLAGTRRDVEDLKSQQRGLWDHFKDLELRVVKTEKLEHPLSTIPSLGKRLSQVEQRLVEMVDSMPMLWTIGLRQGGDTQKRMLQIIVQTIQSIAGGTEPGADINDRELGHIIPVLDCVDLSDLEARRLYFAIRDQAYTLEGSQFVRTKSALRDSAESMLESENNEVLRIARAYCEIVSHADEWDIGALKRLEPKLKAARHKPGVIETLRTTLIFQPRDGFGCGFDAGLRRSWKRVWPTETGRVTEPWGRLVCTREGNAVCQAGCVLNEISLLGASCRTCANDHVDGAFELEIHLPQLEGPVRVGRAKYRPHPGQLHGDGTRGDHGIGIEFLEITSEELTRLARFIRGRDELNRHLPPANAPWISRQRAR